MHLGSRYIYELYYEKEAISKKLYEWLLKNNYADANLIAKWKKQGYEKVFQTPIFRLRDLQLTSGHQALLPQMHSDQGDKLQLDMHLQGAPSATQGESNY